MAASFNKTVGSIFRKCYWPQMKYGRQRDGGRKLLMLLVGARGFESPTSRSQITGSAKS